MTKQQRYKNTENKNRGSYNIKSKAPGKELGQDRVVTDRGY